MTGYTKLFGSIVASTIWREPHTVRIVWITMLAMAGKSGIVEASVPGLADLARVTLDECKEALAALEAPDEYSRTPDNEGRRIEKCDGGWFILNHGKYRAKMSVDERREYLRIKQQESRDKKKAASTNVNTRQPESTRSTHAEASPKEEAEEVTPPTPEEFAVGFKLIVAAYDGLCAYCGVNPWVDIDHIHPTSRGGRHTLQNVAPACKSCNSSKRASLPGEQWKLVKPHPFSGSHALRNGDCRDVTQAEERVQKEEAIPPPTPPSAKVRVQTLRGANAAPPGFIAFWEAYPRGEGKQDALKAWKKWGCESFVEKILETLKRAKKCDNWTKDRGQFIPYASKWLNRGGWDDNYQIKVQQKKFAGI